MSIALCLVVESESDECFCVWVGFRVCLFQSVLVMLSSMERVCLGESDRKVVIKRHMTGLLRERE